jgi:hypothetical protein
MGRQIERGAVEARLVPVGAIDPNLGVVGHQLRRHTAHEGQRPDMRADPIRQALGQGCLGVGVVGRAHHGDEDLRWPDLAGSAISQIDNSTKHTIQRSEQIWSQNVKNHPISLFNTLGKRSISW